MGAVSASTASLLKLLQLSFSFLLVFLAFNGTQTIMSSLLPGKLGYWCLSCIYVSFTTCSLLVSTGVVLTITPKWAMFAGSIIYAGFIAANLAPMWYTLVPLAVALGLAASLVWSGQGAYVTADALAHATAIGRPARASLGLFNGIFYGIFQLSMLVGNILSSVILAGSSSSSSSQSSQSSSSNSGNKPTGKAQILFFSYVAICGLGVVGLLLLPHPSKARQTPDDEEASARKKKMTVLQRLSGAVMLLKDPRMFLFVPFLFFTGIEQAFIFGDFTKNYVKETHGLAMVGFVMSVFGACDSLSSVVLGRVADRVGPRWIAVFGVVVFGGFIPWIGFARDTAFGRSLAGAFVWSGVLGISDAAIFSVFCNAAMATLFHDRSEAAFSNVKVFQALGTALSFFLGPVITFNIKLYVLTGTLVLGALGIFILDRFVQPLTKVTEPSASTASAATPEDPSVQHTAGAEAAPLLRAGDDQ